MGKGERVLCVWVWAERGVCATLRLFVQVTACRIDAFVGTTAVYALSTSFTLSVNNSAGKRGAAAQRVTCVTVYFSFTVLVTSGLTPAMGRSFAFSLTADASATGPVGVSDGVTSSVGLTVAGEHCMPSEWASDQYVRVY